ncbi:MAG: CoA transferase [Burkholderiales bacterium]|jgi:crotonobetainyl-CoA:carnitine CoA-transferase CaiB-like acyl-CoA transferase
MTPPSAALLEGVRILDMATVLAAPFAATLCGDLGAEVTKLELPDGSDPLRRLSPVQDGHALWWKVANRGKRGITLDVRRAAGRELFLRLIARYDVLVENFRPGTLDRWGLDLATLRAANPGLVVLRLSGFGQTGPLSDRPGFARVFEAMGGLAHLIGDPRGAPQHANYPMGDVIAGVFGAFAIAAAVARVRAHPDETPPELDLSATESLLRVLDALPVEHERTGEVRGRSGNRATYTAPSNMYRTADGVWMSLVASSDAIFERLCRAMDAGAMATDPRFATMRARLANVDRLDETIAAWFARTRAEAALAACEREGVPLARVADIAAVMSDPHLVARGAIVRLPDPQLGSLPAPAVVPRAMGAPPLAPPRTGPLPGEHNDAVWGELGLDAAALEALRRDGVI